MEIILTTFISLEIQALTPSTLCKILSSRFVEIFFSYFSPEKRFWHFMQIVFIFLEKKIKRHKFVVCWIGLVSG